MAVPTARAREREKELGFTSEKRLSSVLLKRQLQYAKEHAHMARFAGTNSVIGVCGQYVLHLLAGNKCPTLFVVFYFYFIFR